ncbi:MAG TPA: cytochrome c [Caballeronia sp.]|nr:cytochrome c [Caballeronia sp.]
MKRSILALSLLFAAAITASAFAAPLKKAPPSKVSIALPGDLDFAFKKAPGVDIVQTNCLGCHSSAYVSTQPKLTQAQWTAEVTKMKAAYGASISDADSTKIVEYLTANYGKP